MEDGSNIEKNYAPKEFEERIYKMWEEGKYFTPTVDKSKKPYSIVMPPPNITGKLHMGHALNNTLQDVIIRFKRMQGFSTLWLPGEDHASIATEVKVENELLKSGIKKSELGREAFLEKVWEWTDEYRARIRDQLKKLGCSADFTRESFTMDENLNQAVKEVFVKFYREGLIYQGNRIINWCPKCKTAISDAENIYEEQAGSFWYIKYPIVGSDAFIEIATTRPETMLGDTAIAVNPKDSRYTSLIGKFVMLPLVNKEIPIIADDYVDIEFGTGAVKITPAHDINDYQVGKRHNLPQINIMNEDGSINSFGGIYEGLDRYEARKRIVKDLEELGLLVKIVPHVHNVGVHDRCNTVVESLISKQWFVKMDTLAVDAIKVVKNKEIKFIPERFEKIYFNWMENIQDWCISRQLWWGHRIPVWYCKACGEVIVAIDAPNECPKCKSHILEQDKDVLDTWFSSALWPFSTLGWPNKTEDLDYFYPTNTLVTASDIIFFWVARMIFSGLHNMGKIPFDTVIFNSLVRDSEGRKMSKSLGNGIDPLDIIDKYGADALRFMLVTGNAPGNDIRFREEKVEAGRNFANKIWNASRFVMMNLDEELINKYDDNQYTLADRWILSRLNRAVGEVTDNLEKFEIAIASQKIYDFIWNEFCDWYIELAKPVLFGTDEALKSSTLKVLKKVLLTSLKLLHPIMPFITEEIYSHIIGDASSICIAEYPVSVGEEVDIVIEEKLGYIIDAIKGIRNVRTELNVPPSRKAKLLVIVKKEAEGAFKEGAVYFEKLASVSSVDFIDDKNTVPENAVAVVTTGAEMYIPLLDLIDLTKELERLNKEKLRLQGEIDRVINKLSNERFISKAPEAVVKEEKEKGEAYKEMLNSVLKRIEDLSR
ncbi:MAG TPA: valine--tRNA ligase [Clostridiaceae bacterium]